MNSEQINVCKSCRFQTLSLPVYKRHIKYCTKDSSDVMKMSYELMNGNTKELHLPIGSKEIHETSNTIKPQASASRNLLYCKLCAFSCSVSSQLINHVKRAHSLDNKSQDQIRSSLQPNIHNNRQLSNNGISTLKLNRNMEESTTKKEIVLKKLKLEIPGAENALGIVGPNARDLQLDSGAATNLVISSPTTMMEIKEDERSRKCAECGFVAKNRDSLIAHKTNCHESNIVYSCNECDYRTPVRKNFERHEWCHAIDGPFKCQFCSFSSNGENTIKRHMSAYHMSGNKKLSELPIIPPPISMKTTKMMPKIITKKIKIESLHKMPEKLLSEFVNDSSATFHQLSPSNSALSKHFLSQTDDQPSFVCSQCGLCYNENHLLEQHVATSHPKYSIHINSMSNPARPLIHHDQKMLKQLEVPQTLKLHPSHKVAPRGEQRSEEVRKVYKCGYCNFSVNEFSKLREHMESNACHPSDGTNLPSLTATSLANETVLQKLLINDNPTKAHPTLLDFASKNETLGDSSTSEMKNFTRADEPFTLLDLPRSTDLPAFSQYNSLNGGLSPEKHSLLFGNPDNYTKTGKTYISCLLCTYKTLSEKILRKHLIQEHPQVISSKRILREIIQKCINISSNHASRHHANWKDTTKIQMNMPGGSVDDNASECSKLLLQMDVHCETENNPPYISKQMNDTSKFMPYKCSSCGKRSNWKHLIKKHVSEKHSNASLIILSPEEAESTYEFYQNSFTNRLSSRVTHNHVSTGNAEKALNFSHASTISSENVGSEENLGMSDLLRLKRFKCSVCIYRSNFRCDISRHLKKRHPNIINCHYTVMSVQEAMETLPSYRYTWPEAEALLLGSYAVLVKEEVIDLAKIDLVAERKANALISRLPFNREDGKRCNICPFVTNKAELLRLHLAYHQPQKRNCYSCPHCPFFVNTSRLLQHHLTLHENDQFIRSVAAERTATQQLNAYNMEFNFVKRNPKFICEDCPYTSNNRNEFWKHRKGHLQRVVVPSDLKCHHCPYWAEDKRDWHLHCSLHGGMQRSYTKKRADLAIGEFCRCDLANLKDYSDLSCFKELRCPSCSVRSPSVMYMRHHMLTHMAFTDAVRHKIFDREFDQADKVLGNLCTRLLNMNYSLADECRGGGGGGGNQNSAEDEEKQMPVLEKVTEVKEDSLPVISFHLTSSIFYDRPRTTPIPKLIHSRIVASQQLTEVLTDDYVLSVPEEVIEFKDDPISSSTAETENDERRSDDENLDTFSDINLTKCPHATTFFFLNLGIVRRA